jgi:hypothetical protein
MYKYKEMVFNDVVKDDNGHRWSQMCKKCVEKFNIKNTELDECGSGICGIEGCNNQSDFYIDFNDNIITKVEK